MGKQFLGLLTLTLTLNTFASAEYYDDQYQEIQSVELYEVSETENGEQVEVLVDNQKLPSGVEIAQAEINRAFDKRAQNLSDVIMTTKNLIAIGKEIYKIIDAGKPVVNIDESKAMSVLPRDEKGMPVDSFRLSGWSMPKAKKYKVIAKNYLGMSPVSFEFMMIYTYGGNMDGKGKYLTGTQIKPTSVDVSWAYELNATFSVQSIVNQGTSEDPIAGAVLMIDYSIKTVLKESRNSKTFFVNGLGQNKAF
ncbi:MAG: hypothetical protein KC478_17450 [Bacteriovoracaceae bacterium]|nr:hypothetical protein [Bacteriovoracaceae bacterium]